MVAEHSKSNILEVMKEGRNFSHMALASTCPFVDVPLHDNNWVSHHPKHKNLVGLENYFSKSSIRVAADHSRSNNLEVMTERRNFSHLAITRGTGMACILSMRGH